MDTAAKAEAAVIAASQLVSNAGKTGMRESAEICLTDAREMLTSGDYVAAHRRALASLEYSVGVFDANYKAVK
jgi:hypothetical protein